MSDRKYNLKLKTINRRTNQVCSADATVES